MPTAPLTIEPTEQTQQTQQTEQTERLMLQLLTATAAAHGAYEAQELGGVWDQDWPSWYAAHLTRALAERGYRLVRATSTTEHNTTSNGENDVIS